MSPSKKSIIDELLKLDPQGQARAMYYIFSRLSPKTISTYLSITLTTLTVANQDREEELIHLLQHVLEYGRGQ